MVGELVAFKRAQVDSTGQSHTTTFDKSLVGSLCQIYR
jgi:hypothetical protein